MAQVDTALQNDHVRTGSGRTCRPAAHCRAVERLTDPVSPGHVWCPLLPAAELVAPATGPACAGARRGGIRRSVRATLAGVNAAPAASLVFEDETALPGPVVRRTSAPRGETPVPDASLQLARLSVAVALAFRWDGRCPRLFFRRNRARAGPTASSGFSDTCGATFLGSASSCCGTVCPAQERGHARPPGRPAALLTAERLPSYAPNLNPVERSSAMSRAATRRPLRPELATLAHALRTGLAACAARLAAAPSSSRGFESRSISIVPLHETRPRSASRPSEVVDADPAVDHEAGAVRPARLVGGEVDRRR